jgi:hypothetical protein
VKTTWIWLMTLALAATVVNDEGAIAAPRKAPLVRRKPTAVTKPKPEAPPDPVSAEPTSARADAAPTTLGEAPAGEAKAAAPEAKTPEEPVPAEKPPAQETSKESGARAADVASLRAEYEQLKDAVFRSRARRETMESALLSTKIAPTLRWDGSRHYSITKAEVKFDGVRLWETRDGVSGDSPIAITPRSAAPGPHVLGVRVEVRPRDNSRLGYVSEQSFAVVLKEGKTTKVEITVDEDGDLPSYNPEIEIEIEIED